MENDFGKRLKDLLEEKGMTQRTLAGLIDATEMSVSRYINGNRTPRGPVIVQIAKALGVTTDYLLGNSGE